MATTYYIGADDTDFGDSIGTGALARELQLRVATRFGAKTLGITRHQFLVHPDIPYTSHNSSACVAAACDAPFDEVTAACVDLIAALEHPGADPGLCVRREGELTAAALDFARRAQREVVTKAEAVAIARAEGAFLKELGGAGIGVIGALAGCALRMSGDDGRFVSLRGIRDFRGHATAGAILAATPIVAVLDEEGGSVPDDAVIRTNHWVRPWLRGGRIVLVVKRDGAGYSIENNKRREEG